MTETTRTNNITVGVLWASSYNDFERATIIEHWLGVDRDDIMDIVNEYIEGREDVFYWVHIFDGEPTSVKPSLVTISEGES
jgi:hypothetical protein